MFRMLVSGHRAVSLLGTTSTRCVSRGVAFRGLSSPAHHSVLMTATPTQSYSSNSSSSSSDDPRQRAKRLSALTGATCAVLSASYILYLQLKARADEGTKKGIEGETGVASTINEGAESDEEGEEPKKKRISFHDQKVMAYEDRIRAYSTPDKIFRYFATLKVIEGSNDSRTIYMTPSDFIRSITPGMMQPQEYGLDLFKLVTIDTVKKEELAKVDNPNSVFRHMGHNGLISFSDFLFLLTIIATPVRNFELAFKMFDLNGDGDVELSEFETVRSVLMSSTGVGSKHRDHFINGNVDKSVGGALVEHFFGPNGDLKLTLDQFHKFHAQLCREMLEMEFKRFDPKDDIISEVDFAHFVVDYSPLNSQKKKKIIKRVRKKYVDEPSKGISFGDLVIFDEIMDNLVDIDMALGLYYAAGVCVSPAELRLTCEAVTGTKINDHLLDVLFTLFDDNGDGELSRAEFVTIMKARNSHGLQRSRELGLARLFSALATCSAKTVKDQIGMGTNA